MLSEKNKQSFQENILDIIIRKQHLESNIGSSTLEQEIKNFYKKNTNSYVEESELDECVIHTLNYVPKLNDTLLGVCGNYNSTRSLKSRLYFSGASDDFSQRVQSYVKISHFLGIKGEIKVPLFDSKKDKIYYVDVSLGKNNIEKIPFWIVNSIMKYSITLKQKKDLELFETVKEVFFKTYEAYNSKRRMEDVLIDRCKTNKTTYLPMLVSDDSGEVHEAGIIYSNGYILVSPPYGFSIGAPKTLLFKIAPRFLNDGVLSEQGMVLLRGLMNCEVENYIDKLYQLILTSAQLTNSTPKSRETDFNTNVLSKFDNTNFQSEYDISINTVLGLIRGLVFLLESKGEISLSSGTIQAKSSFMITKFNKFIKDLAVEDLIALFKRQSDFKEHYLNRMDILKLLAEQQHGNHEDQGEAKLQINRLVKIISSLNMVKREKALEFVPEKTRKEVRARLKEDFELLPLENKPFYSEEEFFERYCNLLDAEELDLEWKIIEMKVNYCVYHNKYLKATVLMKNEPFGCAFYPKEYNKEELKFAFKKTNLCNQNEGIIVSATDEKLLKLMFECFKECEIKNFELTDDVKKIVTLNAELKSALDDALR